MNNYSLPFPLHLHSSTDRQEFTHRAAPPDSILYPLDHRFSIAVAVRIPAMRNGFSRFHFAKSKG
eukprot:scaffold76964_cov57-Attheya_sp.AAC.2